MLIIFGGLPGTGKTTLSRELARRLGAIHLRIDSIEQAILNSSIAPRSVEEAGYFVGYAVAQDNLRLGRKVVADSVNPLSITREAWRKAAEDFGVQAFEVEVLCSNADEHRRRVEHREADLPGQKLPTWREVQQRAYDSWESPQLRIDTASESLGESLARIAAALPQSPAV